MGSLKSLLRWARISRTGDDARTRPVQQVTYLGKVGDALMWFPYGYHAVPPEDELVLLLSLQGNPEARVGLPGSPTARPTIASDEVVVFHPPTGSKIHFRSNGDIDIVGTNDVNVTAAGDVNVVATSGKVTMAASLIEAALGATLRLMDERFIAFMNAHVHSGVNVGGGNTGAPTTTASTGSHATSALRGS